MKILLPLMILIVVGCKHFPIDRVPSGNDLGLRNIELASCETRDLGILGCIAPEDLTTAFLKIPTGLEGEYQIRSNKCGFFEEGSFSNNETLSFSYAHLLRNKEDQKECLYDVKLFVDNFKEILRGLFKITDLESFNPAKMTFQNRDYQGTASFQFRTELNPANNFRFNVTGTGTILIDGCNKQLEERYDGVKNISFEALAPKFKKTCHYVIGILPDNESSTPELFSLTLARFDKATRMISKPRVWFKGKDIKFSFEQPVSQAMVNGKLYTFKCGVLQSCQGNRRSEIKIDYDPSTVYWIRLFTTNGRYNLFKYYKGELIWTTHSILY